MARSLDLAALAGRKSLFLFGPRQTGKSMLVRHALPGVRVYDLLDSPTFLALAHSPNRLGEELGERDRLVVVDEIQKLPTLLDEVHRLIESRGIRFVLTGSSARKLRRGGVNLLGGRARSRTLHPFIRRELRDFDLIRALGFGTLPSVWFSDSPEEDLGAYVGDYLRLEVAAEALVRSVPAFGRFLEVAAACNAQILNQSQVASDAQVPRTTVQEYFEILRDTLVACEVPAWRATVKRKAMATSKFYFFDVGVVRSLQNRGRLKARSPEVGEAFETWIHHELRSWSDYVGETPLSYWRSLSGFEVDFILGDSVAIEVKAKEVVGERDLRGLQAFREERAVRRYMVVCLERTPRMSDGIEILPWEVFLKRLWAGDLKG